jgi:hypothetical protein
MISGMTGTSKFNQAFSGLFDPPTTASASLAIQMFDKSEQSQIIQLGPFQSRGQIYY